MVAYVTATDSGVFDVDEDIVGVDDFGDWAFLELDLFDAFEDEGEVLCCKCC